MDTNTNERYRDFDAFWAEKEKAPVQLKIFGEVENLPSALPVAMMLKMMRLNAKGRNNMTETEVMETAISVFGEERVDRWASKGLDIDQLQDLIKWAVETYTGNALTPEKKPGAKK